MKTRRIISIIIATSLVAGIVQASVNGDKARDRNRKKIQIQEQNQEVYQNQYRYQKQLSEEEEEILKSIVDGGDGYKDRDRDRIRDQKKLGEQECDGAADQTRLQKQLRGDAIEDEPEYEEFLKFFGEDASREQLQTRTRDQKKTGDEDCEPIQQRDQLRDQKQEQLQDGSCQEELLKAFGDQDQLQTRTRDQKKDSEPAEVGLLKRILKRARQRLISNG